MNSNIKLQLEETQKRKRKKKLQQLNIQIKQQLKDIEMKKLIYKTKEAYLAQKLFFLIFYFDKIKPGSENLELKEQNLNRLVNRRAK